MDKLKIEATKFTLVSVVNFVLTFIIFTLLLKTLGVNYLLSLTASWFAGVLFSYIFNFLWVFKPEEKIQFRASFIRFLLASTLSILLNILALKYLVEHTGFDPFYLQIAFIPFIAIFNFSTAKYWSLRQRPPHKNYIFGKEENYSSSRKEKKNRLRMENGNLKFNSRIVNLINV